MHLEEDVTRLDGRRALVTGATGGIGRAIAEAMVRQGASVVVSGRDGIRGLEVVQRLRELGGRAEFVEADLSSGSAARALAGDAVAAAGGNIDILVNNAASMPGSLSLLETSQEQIEQTMALNVTAPFLLTAALVPGMIERGAGAVINIGSSAGAKGLPGHALYGASKAALHNLTRSWATELGPRGVRVNAVVPGPTVTELNADSAQVLQTLSATYPARRAGTAAEVADAVVFLVSDQAAYIHGVILPVDGGGLAR
jgi:NAD(P)-dependent dehydrogenase (short-subunit alcohol dehydrogenase family)